MFWERNIKRNYDAEMENTDSVRKPKKTKTKQNKTKKQKKEQNSKALI